MSGLSDAERMGFRHILKIMSREDVLSLSDTVTNKRIAVGSVTEAIDAILSYTKDAEDLLKRRKLQRDIIFKYLAKEGVVMPTDSDKNQLVKRTLSFWTARQHINSHALVSQTSTVVTSPGQRPSAPMYSDTEASAVLDYQTLAREFCQWFFQLYNSQNPYLSRPPQDWGPQHFWDDVCLRLINRFDGEQLEFHGSDMTSKRLLALAKDERILLNPNMSPDGLKVLHSPHGLVLIAVAGTVHRDSHCMGVYEQVFGLIRSPLDNKWKIKFVNLTIGGSQVMGGAEALVSPPLNSSTTELQVLLLDADRQVFLNFRHTQLR